jgi:hypothetical protein
MKGIFIRDRNLIIKGCDGLDIDGSEMFAFMITTKIQIEEELQIQIEKGLQSNNYYLI